MIRSILFNFWTALFVFAVYFSLTIYQTNGTAQPLPTILKSFVWAVIAFVVAFGLKYLLNYILYTPEVPEMIMIDEENTASSHEAKQENIIPNKNSTVEFADESSEDIAQVVRTMLSNE